MANKDKKDKFVVNSYGWIEKFWENICYLDVSEKEYCNQVLTKKLTNEIYPDDNYSDD